MPLDDDPVRAIPMMPATVIVAMSANDDHTETVVVMIVAVYVAHMG